MKEFKLNKAKELSKEIEEEKDLLENVKKLLPQEGNSVTVKIRGTKFELPKRLFVAQLDQKVKDMEKEIDNKEEELSKL